VLAAILVGLTKGRTAGRHALFKSGIPPAADPGSPLGRAAPGRPVVVAELDGGASLRRRLRDLGLAERRRPRVVQQREEGGGLAAALAGAVLVLRRPGREDAGAPRGSYVRAG
jgi:Fe2+ transport system protein FeoA